MEQNRCADCREWTQDRRKATEVEGLACEHLDESRYGRCMSLSPKWLARHDGGYNGELITRDDFGCTEFEAK